MPWTVESIAVAPEAAIEFFRSRLPVTDPEFRALSDAARRRAFFVAGLARLDLMQEVMNALDAALAEGETFEGFRERLSQQVARAWGGQSPHRLRTIFDTNLQMAYGAGRWKAADELRDSRPYWGLEVVLDGRTSSICRNLAGVVRPADDPFWRNHIPPLHFRCRTALVTYSAEQARGRVSESVPDQPPLEGFGRPPNVEGWKPRASDYDPELWAAHQRLSNPAPAGNVLEPEEVDPVSKVMYGQPRRLEFVDEDEVKEVRRVLESTQELVRESLALDRDLTPQDLIDLAGVPNGGRVKLFAWQTRQALHASIEAVHDDLGIIHLDRSLVISPGRSYVINERFDLAPSARGAGLGTRVFFHQALRASQVGFDHIETLAVRTPDKNGYYTWPRLGMNARLGPAMREVIAEAYRERYGRELPAGVNDFHGLFVVEGGPELWWDIGHTVELTFDLDPSSRHWKFLRSYVVRKGYGVAPDW